ncbi:hypothetical protein PCANC_20218 [Puccinia coronata f. sp. avenae]|uniref:Uncharacterized protein n=1 Tax=Puccinia coronata f. sp. avenae TaxID=200324 RepID=A0A2N5U3U6_9BASI|nr:hypothetical protein PCANC_20218 [Puccinia coronata f. sp. avenae]
MLPALERLTIVLIHRDWDPKQSRVRTFKVMYLIEARKDMKDVGEKIRAGRLAHLAGELAFWERRDRMPVVYNASVPPVLEQAVGETVGISHGGAQNKTHGAEEVARADG